MTNHKTFRPFVLFSVCASFTCALLVTGCGESKPVQQAAVAPTPPPPPPAPPKPRLVPVEQLKSELNIDPRVNLPEDAAPGTTKERRAVLEFFDAMARGDSEALKSMMAVADQLALDNLVRSGDWTRTVEQIELIEIQTGTNAVNQPCALAVIEVGSGPDMTFQPQLWYYTAESERPQFEAAPSPPLIMDKLSGDWITAWHTVLSEEMALADKPEAEFDVSQKDLDDGDEQERGSRGGQRGPGNTTPSKPGKGPPKVPL